MPGAARACCGYPLRWTAYERFDHVQHLVVWLLLPPEEGPEGGGDFVRRGRHRDRSRGGRVRGLGQWRQSDGADAEVRGRLDADQPERRRGQSQAGEARELAPRADIDEIV